MTFSVLSAGLVLFAAAFVFIGSKILLHRGWLAGFVRGASGLFCIALAVMSVLIGVNLLNYQQVEQEGNYFYISFQEQATQQYQVNILNTVNGEVLDFELQGDTWQVMVKQMRLLSSKKMYYQLDHIQSRYYALEQDRQAKPNAINLASSSYGLDIARWLKNYGSGRWTTTLLKNTYYPAADGARFAVSVTAKGLEVKAENSAAKDAVEQWL